jgi:hypothetical protein
MKPDAPVSSPRTAALFKRGAILYTLLKHPTWQLLALVIFATPARSDVGVVVGERPADYPERYRATYAIPRTLAAADVAKLLSFLERPLAAGGLPEGEFAALKNNVADALISHDPLPPKLDDRLLAQYRDGQLGDLWRGFIVQKGAELAMRLSGDRQRRVVNFLWERLGEPSGMFAAEAA